MTSPLLALVESRDWDGVEANLSLDSCDRETLTTALSAALYEGTVPGCVIRSFVEKLRRHRNREVSKVRPFLEFPRRRRDYLQSVVWFEVCCFGTFVGKGPTDSEWRRLCNSVSPEALREILDEYRRYNEEISSSTDARLPMNEVMDSVLIMWRSYLAPHQQDFLHGNVSADKRKEKEIGSIRSIKCLRGVTSLRDLWHKTQLLIDLATNTETPLPHILVREQFPNLLVWLCGKLYPEKFRERDRDGRVPLHYVSGCCRDLAVTFSHALSVLNEESSVGIVSHVYPEGACYLDNKGKLPLTLLVESRDVNAEVDDLIQLIKLAPQALSTRDKESHLFPFMVAATRRPYPKIEDIFLLLREEPSVIASLVMRVEVDTSLSYYERHLKKRLLDSQRESSLLKEREKKLTEENRKLKAQVASLQKDSTTQQRERTCHKCANKRSRTG